MKFEITSVTKKLRFDSNINGLKIGQTQFEMGSDGILIYDKVKNIKANEVTIQMSSDTSTLIPALKILGWPYHPYFDSRKVVESQNDITFYWNKSKLAAFYNKYATDNLKYRQREKVIKNAIIFLSNNQEKLNLREQYLERLAEQCLLVGFYQGFPIFDSSKGLAKLQSRLGIHIDPESIMISTPLDKYETDIYELAENIHKITKEKFTKKKNRVIFSKNIRILKLLQIKKV